MLRTACLVMLAGGLLALGVACGPKPVVTDLQESADVHEATKEKDEAAQGAATKSAEPEGTETKAPEPEGTETKGTEAKGTATK